MNEWREILLLFALQLVLSIFVFLILERRKTRGS